ncbi:MAG: STAS domain-containing protein [Chromatiales bacterium]|nr:STAS domain-containing protein [Chromatiales bacterium]
MEPAGPGVFAINGPVTFATAGALLDQGLARFAGQDAVTVNFADVTRVDSAGLALLLEWLRQARGDGRTLGFAALPDKLLAIARLSGVDGLLAEVHSGPAAPPASSSGSSSRSSR